MPRNQAEDWVSILVKNPVGNSGSARSGAAEEWSTKSDEDTDRFLIQQAIA